jgi:hypothetical protein
MVGILSRKGICRGGGSPLIFEGRSEVRSQKSDFRLKICNLQCLITESRPKPRNAGVPASRPALRFPLATPQTRLAPPKQELLPLA